ncbi:hypothetical protein [Halarchaeum salinum]|uniref:hypothetical protein n=1 Tax=Halarchaeum salinum TaxID=489912 RepID=UPI001B86608C
MVGDVAHHRPDRDDAEVGGEDVGNETEDAADERADGKDDRRDLGGWDCRLEGAFMFVENSVTSNWRTKNAPASVSPARVNVRPTPVSSASPMFRDIASTTFDPGRVRVSGDSPGRVHRRNTQ